MNYEKNEETMEGEMVQENMANEKAEKRRSRRNKAVVFGFKIIDDCKDETFLNTRLQGERQVLIKSIPCIPVFALCDGVLETVMIEDDVHCAVLFDRYSDGFCPECMLKGKMVSMILNYGDYWECPECRLQAHTASGGMFSILRIRGKGDLKPEMKHTVATNQIRGCILTKVDATNPYRGDSNSLDTPEELLKFIKEEVFEPEQDPEV